MTEAQRNASLRFSTWDGMCHAFMVGIGEGYMIPYAISLKATPLQLGLLASLPLLVGSLAQLWALPLLKIIPRKKFVVMGVMLQAMTFLPILGCGWLGVHAVSWLLVFSCVYWIFGLIISSAWNGWMGDLVPEDRRGRYFGNRNRFIYVLLFFGTLSGGIILHKLDAVGLEQWGYVMTFFLAFTARMISAYFLGKQFDPPHHHAPRTTQTLLGFTRTLRQSNFGTLVLYLGCMNFAIYTCLPYFSVFMLESLNLSYAEYMMVNATLSVSKFIFMPMWGRFSDQHGSRKILAFSGYLMPIIPFVWMFSSHVRPLMALQVYSGLVWAAFELCSLQLMYENLETPERTQSFAFYNAVNALFSVAGALCGAWIVKWNFGGGNPYRLSFFVSGVLRFISSFLLLSKLSEVRAAQPISYQKLFFKILSMRPGGGLYMKPILMRHHETTEAKESGAQTKPGVPTQTELAP